MRTHRSLIAVFLLLGCSGDPFTAGYSEPPRLLGEEAGEDTAPAPVDPCAPGDLKGLCAPCSGIDFGAPGPGECQEIAAVVSQRFVQCMLGKCSFNCDREEIGPGVCPSLPGQCIFPVAAAQALFCSPL